MPGKQDRVMEADLYAPVKSFLAEQGYDVKAEVHGCDVVAVRDEELLVVELKLGITMPLLVQAIERQRIADGVYVAIPRPKLRLTSARWRGVCRLLRRLQIGLLLVRPEGTSASSVEVAFHPTAQEPRKAPRIRQAVIRETKLRSGDYNVGGSHHRKLVTAYRENAIHVACCLERFGDMTPRALRKLGTGEKTLSILRDNYYGWFERVGRGVYRLSGQGRVDLASYGPLVNHYQSALPEVPQGSTVTSVP